MMKKSAIAYHKSADLSMRWTANATMLMLVLVFSVLLSHVAIANDTLAVRAFYVENYSYGSLDADIGSGFALPPQNFAWGKNKTTHTIMFGGSGDAGMFTQTSPYWGPVSGGGDSVSLFFGNTGQPFWRAWRDSTHANGGFFIQSFNAVSSTSFDFVAADSARSETFWRAFIMWAIRNEVDGGDLDAESSTQSAANRTRFFRIGRRLGYNALWQGYITATGKPGFSRNNGKMIIGNALFMLDTGWMLSSADSTIDFFDLQAYNYHNMWGGSGNRPWYQTPWGVPPGQACGTCEAGALGRGFSSGVNLIQEWVNAGWSRKKIVVGFDPGAVTVYTGTTALGTGTPSGYQSDWARQDFEGLVSHGGTRAYNAIAMAPYISGTANGGGLSGAFVGSYTDSVSLKAICDSLYKVGAGGIMVYAVAKDVATLGSGSNHALDYYRTPTISAGSYRAWQLNGGAPPPPPAAPTATTSAATSISQNAATLNGAVNANGASTTVRFVWGSVSGNYTDSALAAQSPIPSGLSGVSTGLTGLNVSTTYYYRIRAYNSLGNVQGSEVSFTTNATASAPAAATNSATSVTQTTATLNGTVNANGASTIVRFVYGTIPGAYSDSAVASQSPVAGNSPVSIGTTGINAGTTYYYRVRAYNSAGGVQGSEVSFTTLLPGGQGVQDITAQGIPVALITTPTGEGNHDIEVMRDGVTPPVGSTDVLQQYDTFTGGAARAFDWIGFQFATARSFAGITYQEGLDNQWGGCFVTLQVQVRTGGVWTDVQNLVSNPPYAGTNLVNYETYELSFNQVSGDAIRIAGVPTGSAHYVGVGELRIFESQSAPPPSAPQLVLPANAATNQPVSVTLNWRAILGATSCQVQVSTDSLFTTMIVNDSTVIDSIRQLNSLQFLTKYYWRVRARNAGGYGAFSSRWNFTTRTQTGVDGNPPMPKDYSLEQNYPNPFNPVTNITFSLPHADRVRLTVFNVLGQAVTTLISRDMEGGRYKIAFDALGLTSGIYFYRLEAGSFVETRRLVVLK